MGFIKKLFGNSTDSAENKEEKALPWISLNSLEQLGAIKEKSKTKTQVVFKHSTRCGISRMVMNQFEKNFGLTENDLDLYYLDLLNYREVSNEIANNFQILHESPQLLVIKNGVVVSHVSHGQINEMDLKQFI